MKSGKTKILTLEINNGTKNEILQELGDRIDQGSKTFITTPNPEFFYCSFWNYSFERIINSANFNLPDGIGVLWAAYFLKIPFVFKNYFLKIFEGFFIAIWTLAEIIFNPSKIRSVIPEKIAGADFFWDLIRIAEEKGLGVYFLGGYGNTPELVAEKVRKNNRGIKVAGYSNSGPLDQLNAAKINQSGAGILFVAYGHPKQEEWIYKNLSELNVKVAIGVGGTFDYIAGVHSEPPQWMRDAGLEWLYRLFTQPQRIKRIWHATYCFCRGVLRHKVMMSMPYRQNVVGVIINKENKVFVGNRIYEYKVDAPDSVAKEQWQFPQGGVDKNEDLEKAVLREVDEETGIKRERLKIIGRSLYINSYLWSHGKRELWFNKLKFKGQQQTIFFLRYAGDDSAIDLKWHDQEFSEYKWVDAEQLVEVVHSYRKSMVEKMLPELKNVIESNG